MAAKHPKDEQNDAVPGGAPSDAEAGANTGPEAGSSAQPMSDNAGELARQGGTPLESGETYMPGEEGMSSARVRDETKRPFGGDDMRRELRTPQGMQGWMADMERRLTDLESRPTQVGGDYVTGTRLTQAIDAAVASMRPRSDQQYATKEDLKNHMVDVETRILGRPVSRQS